METVLEPRPNLTDSIEDYLKVIFELTRNDGRATTSQIAARLGVTPASVTGMLQRLASNDPPFLEYRKHRGATLTSAGERVALEIIRHHRLLELFLHERLGYSWDEVHAEADRLEHVISEAFEERMAQALGDPRHDPHGDPIPSRELELPEQEDTALLGLRPGQTAIVMRVGNEDPEFLRFLGELGLQPQARLEILAYSPFDENLRLEIAGQEVVLGPQVTRQIFVEVV